MQAINTSTRLIVYLMMVVAVVMVGAGSLILRQREKALDMAMRHELRAHVQTLRIALEDHYRAGRQQQAQELIDHLGQNPRVYGVVLFDVAGRVAMVSNPLVAEEIRQPPEVQQVLTTGDPVEVTRRLQTQEVFSIISPVRIDETRRAAVEIAQPLTLIEADLAGARREIILLSGLLFAVISLVVFVVLRYGLAQPINALLESAKALGNGDLQRRVFLPMRGKEFVHLAHEFNRMADSLEKQRAALVQESEHRVALARELRHSERLAAVGRLASGVAHEIGTPLNVIDAHAVRMLHAENHLEEKQRRSLTTIRRQIESISRIMRQLLNLARPYKLQPTAVNLHELLHDVATLLEAEAARNGIQMETHVPADLHVKADQDSLQQVFLNLYTNALQAMSQGGAPGGQLCVEATTPTQRNGEIFAAVRLSDTGPGIAPENLTRIFEPFFTTKDVGSGTGLGLAIAHQIVQEHGGWIEAANQPNRKGAVFTVYLPQAEPPSGAARAGS
jgi:two-component system, NtrC family, sensor kinase